MSDNTPNHTPKKPLGNTTYPINPTKKGNRVRHAQAHPKESSNTFTATHDTVHKHMGRGPGQDFSMWVVRELIPNAIDTEAMTPIRGYATSIHQAHALIADLTLAGEVRAVAAQQGATNER